MRRLLVIVILLGAMLGLDALKTQSGSANPLTLAAVGFVVLASFTLAEFGGGFGLPRVTGYILAGIALGPSALDILSEGEVGEMRTFNALALGLIAIGAGLELDLKQLKRVFETLAGTVVVKVVLGVPLVGAAFWALYPYFESIELADPNQVLTVALSVGVLSVGTSPSIALAVSSETRAKGRLTDLVMGAAVLKDLVVVICLAIAIAAGKSWLALEAGPHSVFWTLTEELGSSLAAGAVLGVILILYIRFVKVEMLLFVAGIILVVSEVGRTLHLELLLVFITAGFVVRNFSKYEHALASAVQLVSLPVFVVFFTIAGAGLDLDTTWQVLPLALALCVVRAVVYYTASRVGGVLGGESVDVQRRAWLGYLPQAGVTLGLVGLTAAQLPTVAEAVLNVGFAMVAVNLLVGPITLKFALRSVGEIPSAVDVPERPTTPSQAPLQGIAATKTPKAPEPAALERVIESIEARQLAKTARRLARSLQNVVLTFEANHVEPWCKALEQAVHRALRAERERADWSQFAEWLERVKLAEADVHTEQCLGLYYDLREQLRRLPELSAVPFSDSDLRVREGDPWRVRLRIRLRRAGRALVFWRQPAPRRVPVQRLARAKMELRLASFVHTTLTAYYRAQAGALEDVRQWVQQHERAASSAEELEASITQRVNRLRAAYHSDADTAIRAGLEALARPLNEFDGPRLPAADVELGKAEPQIKATLDAFETTAQSWARLARSIAEELEAMVALAKLQHEVRDSLLRTVIEPASNALIRVSAIVERVVATLGEVRRELEQGAPGEVARFQQASLMCRAALSEVDHKRLEAAAARYRAAASVHSVAREARLAMQSTPESILVPVLRVPADRLRAATDIELEAVNIRERVERFFEHDLFPALDRRLQEGFATVAATAARVREALDICQHALDYAAESDDPAREAELGEAFTRAVGRLEQHVAELASTRELVMLDAPLKAAGKLPEFVSVAAGATPAASDRDLSGRLWRRLARLWAPGVERLQELHARARAGWTRVLGSQLSRDVQRRLSRDGVDATELAAHIGELRNLAHVPAAYARVFSHEAVREHRLFTANKKELQLVIDTERASLGGGRGSALVVGPVGSGRTSLLNLCELELSAPRIVRPEPLGWRRSVGLETALGIELGCSPALVVDELRKVQTTVLVDDLEHWFLPNADGLAGLSAFLELVVRSDDRVFWLVTVEQATLDLLEELLPIQPAFSRVVRMPPLGPSELAAAVEGRHVLTGRKLSYPSNLTTRLLSKLGKGDSREICFRVLASMSDGNLGAALAQWPRMCTFTDAGDVIATPRFNLGAGAALLAQLPATELAILTELTRFGPFTPKEIAKAMELSESEARRHTHFLRTARVLEPVDGSGDVLRISSGFEPMVVAALEQAGAVRRR